MGYSHYWERKARIDLAVWKNIIADFTRLVPAMVSNGVALAGGLGTAKPGVSRR
jgi:hypothetical protein